MSESNELVIATKADQLGSISSGFSLEKQVHREMVDGDSALSLLGSASLTGAMGVGMVVGGLLTMSPALFFAPVIFGALGFARMKIRSKQLSEVFQKVSKNPLIDSPLLAKVQSETSKYVTDETIRKFKRVSVYHAAFENGSIARIYVYWERWNICIFEFEVYGKHKTNQQIESWDATFKSAAAIKE